MITTLAVSAAATAVALATLAHRRFRKPAFTHLMRAACRFLVHRQFL